ncbi:hypothetical protein ACK03K_34260 [[Kitasatospora] papulosa]|uniref:hypothetical protein n=1 Tax=[Kitasatospora] papulosa TaxID=1464011 RepID=UPI0039081239
MVSNHGKKQRAKNRSRRTGAAYASAAARTTHVHEPLPDMSVLEQIPYLAERDLDLDLAARLVAACRTGCQPCQKTLADKVRREHRSTLAALAAAAFHTLPAGPLASPTTRSWAQLARAAKSSMPAALEALAAADTMDDAEASDLLEDTLDHWAAGAATSGEITNILNSLGTEPPTREQPASPMDALREAGIKVMTLDDMDLHDLDLYHLQENYGVAIGQTTTPDGHPLPMLALYPETEGAGIRDLEQRTGWERWAMYGLPTIDPRWRVRARISDRSLRGLVLIGPDGEDADELWRAAEPVTMPAEWWDLLDRAQHVLVVGPVKDQSPEALNAAARAHELLAVVARVSFA